MFSLIDFGERAGSGLNEVCTVWEKVYHTPATMEETHKNGVDRTILTLSTGGNEQDIKAMLELYGTGSIEYVEETEPSRPESDQKTAKTDTDRTKTEPKSLEPDLNIPPTEPKPNQNRTEKSDYRTNKVKYTINQSRIV